MRLTDIMSHMALSVWAEIALVIFQIVFVLVVARVLFAPKSEVRRIASLPLDDDNETRLFEEVE
ncbi:MAG: hypothetical protein ACIARQ_15765 [Phycisphaerales bacterium JB061]